MEEAKVAGQSAMEEVEQGKDIDTWIETTPDGDVVVHTKFLSVCLSASLISVINETPSTEEAGTEE